MAILDSHAGPHDSAATARTLVVGEAIIDIVARAGSAVRAEYVGGSPANVAAGLARLGHPVDFLTSLAHDERGDRIALHLQESGVRVLDATWSAGRTSTALAEVGPTGSARYSFDIDWSLPTPVDAQSYAAIHTGSIAAFLEPGSTTVRELLRVARAAGALVTFDPNIREALLPSHEMAVAAFESTARLSHLVKLSDEDAAWLYPGQSTDAVATAVLALGADLVTVTAGGDGAVLATLGQRVTVSAVAVEVVDTIGAGDTFMAALIAQAFDVFVSGGQVGLVTLDPASIAEIGEFCVRASAITVSREGANPPTAADLGY